MQFKHPELLYALFLLLIPILVHLFQLRKFKKVPFTNVAFLQKVKLQTRKSNTIKRWLILCARMAAIGMIVLAFAQPFLAGSDNATQEKEYVVYLDNSFSMQARGSSGPLLKQAVQDIITNTPEDREFTLLTNDDVFKNITVKGDRNTLLQLAYSTSQLTPEAISLKAKKEFSSDPATQKRLVVISDFQEKGYNTNISDAAYALHNVRLEPVVKNNVVVDSIFIKNTNAQSLELEVVLSTQELQKTNVPVSLYNGDQLLAKGTASFDESTETSTLFEISNQTSVQGRVEISDPLLGFDNDLYFSINSPKAIRVLAINETNDSFLKRVYSAPEFSYEGVNERNVDFSKLSEHNLIILNEVTAPSSALSNALVAFIKSGGSVICIPNTNTSPAEYSRFLNEASGMSFDDTNPNKRLITTINYDHPLYQDVFENRIQNFQYPSVSSSAQLNGSESILQFEDGNTFLGAQGSLYVFSAALNLENSNFRNSPLIVPTLYNIGKKSLDLAQLYFTINQTNTYDIPIKLQEDDILSIAQLQGENEQIPLQQTFGNKVSITTTEDPKISGIYEVKFRDSVLRQVSYNYDRDESKLIYQSQNPQEGVTYSSSIPQLFEDFQEVDGVKSLWKWFVIFALLFLAIEMLILKFLK